MVGKHGKMTCYCPDGTAQMTDAYIMKQEGGRYKTQVTGHSLFYQYGNNPNPKQMLTLN